MINLTDSLSACTASGILAYAKQIYHQMSGGTATNVEDLLNEHEAKFDNQEKINAMTAKMDKKDNLSLGFGVVAQRGSFGFGTDSTPVYLTGDNKSYTATLFYDQGNTSGNSLFGDIFRSIFRGVHLLGYDGVKVAQITNASYDSDTQVITLTLDTDLGELNDQLYSLENVSGSYNFNAGVFGNKGGDSTCLGYVNMNCGDYSSLVGTTNSNSEDYGSLIGCYNRNDGLMGTVIGTYNTNKGDNSTAIGNYINFGENCTGSAVGSNINIYKGQNTGLGSGVSTAFALGSGLTLSHPSIALGRNNKDYDISGDTQNFFTLGCGEGESPLNLLEQSKNGNLFIKGVGNFDGTNSQSASTKSLQDVLDEIESGLQSAIKLNEYDEVNITYPIYEEGGVGSILCNLVKDDDKIIQDHSDWGSEFADYVGNSHLYIGTNFGNSGIGVLENDDFLGYEGGEEIANVTDSNDKSTIANCIKSPHGYWIIQTESELTASDNLYSSTGNYRQKRDITPFRLEQNGSLYLMNVGGYNGDASTTHQSESLQEVISGISDDVESSIEQTTNIQAKIAELENAKDLLDELNAKMDVLMNDMDVEARFAYGVQWDKTATSPDCTRVGNMLLHAMLPVQSQMRGCLLNDNGEVVKYLAESGWTEETLDGSMGQVMVEIPKFYWKFTESGNTQTVMLSQVPIEGYTKVPKRYVSAYEATIDNNGNTGTTNSNQYKLASVKNTTARYRGCNNVASNDETYKSGLGMPRTNLTLQTYRESARRRKPSTYEWNCYDYMTHKILYWLFVVEFATRHTQKTVDSTTTISGYKTGGLGNGVTTVNNTEWTNLYSNYPIVPCGTSDSLGNGTGEVSYAVPSSGAGDTWTTVKVPRYRGIENPFGHIWKQTDGIKVEVEPGGTTSGESKVYVCYTPSNYNSTSDVTNYNYIGNEERSQGNVKVIIFGSSGDLPTSVNGGGSSTYYGDYHYVKTDNTATEYRSVRFGGAAYYGASAGFVCSDSHSGLSFATSYFGSRLCFIPDAT